MNKTLVKNLRR